MSDTTQWTRAGAFSGHMRQFAPAPACWLAPTVAAKGVFLGKVLVAGPVAVYTQPFWTVLQGSADKNACDSYLRCSCVPPLNCRFVFFFERLRSVVHGQAK